MHTCLFFMYTCYVRSKEGKTHHLSCLYVDFSKACDAMEETIRTLCNDFPGVNREHIQSMIEHRRRAVYFVSEETGDRFILCDLTVIL
jgi:hypothetical protein